MKEHPILFSGPMIPAILDGSKTVTRRPIKPQPVDQDERGPYIQIPKRVAPGIVFNSRKHIRCPYGVPGDELWVREAWRVGAWSDWTPDRHNRRMEICVDYRAGHFVRTEWLRLPEKDIGMFGRLRDQSIQDAQKEEIQPDDDGDYHWYPGGGPTRWRPSIHMPRWASRIQLVVKSVRAERLHEITEQEAKREGFTEQFDADYNRTHSAMDGFRELWDKTYAKKPELQFDANPWVWRDEFEKKERQRESRGTA